MVNQGGTKTPNSFVCVGVINSTHGVKGDVKIHSYTQYSEDLTAYGPLYNQSGTKSFNVRIKHTKGDNTVIASVEGYNDRNSAEQLRGTKLYVPRDALPEAEEEEFYHEDLLGLEAIKPDSTFIGTVKAIHNFGAGDVLEIALQSGKTEMFPFTKAVVPVVNLGKGCIIIHLPEEIVAKEGHD